MKPFIEQPVCASRRDFLRGVGGVAAASTVMASVRTVRADAPALRLSVSDRGVGARQQLGVFALARQAGVGGVEVDLGRVDRSGMMNRLLDADVRRQFSDAVARTGIPISSLALSALGDTACAGHAATDAYVDDLLFVMDRMRVRVGVLPVPADGLEATAARLRRVAPALEKAGATLALRSDLSAAECGALLDRVGSSAVKATIVAGQGRDAVADFVRLGVDRVAQVRYLPDGDDEAGLATLGRTLADAGFDGWVVIDRPAVHAGDDARNLALAAGRARTLFSPALA